MEELDGHTRVRLERGEYPIEGRLDLHGLSLQQAYEALASWLPGEWAQGKRCVLVITGKGRSPDGGPGALRSELPRWLETPPFRDFIRAYTPAAPRHGGDGALYVLLRRK